MVNKTYLKNGTLITETERNIALDRKITGYEDWSKLRKRINRELKADCSILTRKELLECILDNPNTVCVWYDSYGLVVQHRND